MACSRSRKADMSTPVEESTDPIVSSEIRASRRSPGQTSVSKNTRAKADEQVLSDFKNGMASWARAVEAHRLAPPDHNFAQRLTALAQGASEAARVCREAAAAGFQWPPARKADSEPPYELLPDTGRRGPEPLWQRFDQASTRLGTMAAGEDMPAVAGAYEELAAIAGELAEAVAEEDRPRSRRPRTRARRAA
jgi:hypothetical protein